MHNLPPNTPNPCYVISEERLLVNLNTLSRIRKETGCQLLLSLKGFALWKLFPTIAPYIDGVSVSSVNEGLLAAEFFDLPMHAYLPAYTASDVEQLKNKASHFSFNSIGQYNQLGSVVQAANTNTSCGLRLNIGYSNTETALYNPSNPSSRLGASLEDLPQLPAGINGIHIHALCEAKAEQSVQLLQEIEQKIPHLLPHIQWLNIGGGHLATHASYNIDLLIEAIKAFQAKWPHIQLYMEPSSAFAWNTGWLTATVVDIISTQPKPTAMLNVSFTAHMPDCLEMPYKPTVINENAEGKYIYTLGGNSCLAGDFVEGFQFEQPLQIGQQLVFNDMLHYTTVKTTYFNGVEHPSIALLKVDGSVEMLKEFGYEEYRERMC